MWSWVRVAGATVSEAWIILTLATSASSSRLPRRSQTVGVLRTGCAWITSAGSSWHDPALIPFKGTVSLFATLQLMFQTFMETRGQYVSKKLKCCFILYCSAIQCRVTYRHLLSGRVTTKLYLLNLNFLLKVFVLKQTNKHTSASSAPWSRSWDSSGSGEWRTQCW